MHVLAHMFDVIMVVIVVIIVVIIVVVIVSMVVVGVTSLQRNAQLSMDAHARRMLSSARAASNHSNITHVSMGAQQAAPRSAKSSSSFIFSTGLPIVLVGGVGPTRRATAQLTYRLQRATVA